MKKPKISQETPFSLMQKITNLRGRLIAAQEGYRTAVRKNDAIEIARSTVTTSRINNELHETESLLISAGI